LVIGHWSFVIGHWSVVGGRWSVIDLHYSRFTIHDSRFTIHDSRLTNYVYRRPKFLAILLDIRRDMAHEADYDTDLFAEMIRTGRHSGREKSYSLVYDDEDSPPRKRRTRPKNK
jgi:hypothetical protein